MKSVTPDITGRTGRTISTGGHRGREQRAAASNGAPDGVEQVRKALFELVDEVVDGPAYT